VRQAHELLQAHWCLGHMLTKQGQHVACWPMRPQCGHGHLDPVAQRHPLPASADLIFACSFSQHFLCLVAGFMFSSLLWLSSIVQELSDLTAMPLLPCHPPPGP
jgi:hypothetical protein